MQVQGLDYRAIGMAQGHGAAVRIYERAVDRWRTRAEDLEHRLRLAEADTRATDAGRLAQVHALRRALEAHAPFDPVLKTTGRFYAGGDPERVYEAGYADAYDDVGRRAGLNKCVRPMTAWERADAIEAKVLAEPVVIRGWGWWERVTFRGIQYRSVRGAEKARAEAAEVARQEALGS